MKQSFDFQFITNLYKTKKNKIINNLDKMINQIEPNGKKIKEYFKTANSIEKEITDANDSHLILILDQNIKI